MSAGSSRNSPWPAQTPLPEPPILKRQLIPDGSPSRSPVARQIADQSQIEAAMTQCQLFSGNAVISCYPTSDTDVPQHQWATFVWNSRRPELTQTNLVDIFLFHADSLEQVLAFQNVTNPTDQAGLIRAQVNDTWWGDNGSVWSGTNISYPYYWVIIRSDATLDGSEIPQAIFTAVQTTYADSVVSYMSSTSAAAAAASSASSASRESASRHAEPSSAASVQPTPNGSSFPHWAIAVIVILGFFAVATFFVFTFLLIRKIRRRPSKSNRNSIGSSSPMMADVVNSPQSPLLAGGAVAQQPPAHHDGASTLSREQSSEAGGGPFSGADAAIMADAFRKALRKPGFPDLPVEEDSPERRETERLNRELAEEGKDIRNVGSSRGVRVENPS